jgi:serine/threonine-protein kinase HipA
MATTKKEAPFKHANVVSVFVWGHEVGAIALDPKVGYYAFEYTEEFLDTRIDLAPLQMPIDDAGPFIFPVLPVQTYRRLPALVNDALPDDFGNALIDAHMATKGISKDAITPLDRLAYMGRRAMGALEFKPSTGPAESEPDAIHVSELVEVARRAVHRDVVTDQNAKSVLKQIIDVGTSAGGARAKAVIAWNRATNEIRAGQLDAPPGFEHWLLKFDGMGVDRDLGATQNYGRIEFAYHLMAKEAGIDMSECDILSESGRAHFVTKRFDREGRKTRHHMQTLCAMAHVDYKKTETNAYAQLFSTISELGLPYKAMEEAFRRMVFNVMARNCDDHTKNFSFRLRQGYTWELAPAYDVSFAYSPTSVWTHQHLMSVNGQFKNISKADLLEEADRFGVGTAESVIEKVCTAVLKWGEFADQAGIPAAQTKAIKQHLWTLDAKATTEGSPL